MEEVELEKVQHRRQVDDVRVDGMRQCVLLQIVRLVYTIVAFLLHVDDGRRL